MLSSKATKEKIKLKFLLKKLLQLKLTKQLH